MGLGAQNQLLFTIINWFQAISPIIKNVNKSSRNFENCCKKYSVIIWELYYFTCIVVCKTNYGALKYFDSIGCSKSFSNLFPFFFIEETKKAIFFLDWFLLDFRPNHLLLWWQISVKKYLNRVSSFSKCFNETFLEIISPLIKILF